jgi:hypothetical protein
MRAALEWAGDDDDWSLTLVRHATREAGPMPVRFTDAASTAPARERS